VAGRAAEGRHSGGWGCRGRAWRRGGRIYTAYVWLDGGGLTDLLLLTFPIDPSPTILFTLPYILILHSVLQWLYPLSQGFFRTGLFPSALMVGCGHRCLPLSFVLYTILERFHCCGGFYLGPTLAAARTRSRTGLPHRCVLDMPLLRCNIRQAAASPVLYRA